jgi:uncharacterized RDD family membrane protein YckC
MQTDLTRANHPGLFRRLSAIFYDCWLIVGLWFLGGTADFAIQSALGVADTPYRLPLQLYLVLSTFVFFGWFWTHGGQTLGMRAWRLKLLDDSGNPVTWRRSALRFAAACLSAGALGLGYLWVLFDRDRRSWHGRISGTQLVLTERE